MNSNKIKIILLMIISCALLSMKSKSDNTVVPDRYALGACFTYIDGVAYWGVSCGYVDPEGECNRHDPKCYTEIPQ